MKANGLPLSNCPQNKAKATGRRSNIKEAQEECMLLRFTNFRAQRSSAESRGLPTVYGLLDEAWGAKTGNWNLWVPNPSFVSPRQFGFTEDFLPKRSGFHTY